MQAELEIAAIERRWPLAALVHNVLADYAAGAGPLVSRAEQRNDGCRFARGGPALAPPA